MNEEEAKTTITDDDLDVLRVLLHNIKGISAVSSTEYVTLDEPSEE